VSYVHGFAPISRADARILILGSMPGRESLLRQRYYAHPRNAFWPIMADLLKFEEGDYKQCIQQVKHNGIAIWDVLQACYRSGSLDSAIDSSSIVTNDFKRFFADHPQVSRVFFNGAKAESVYLKHVLPVLRGRAAKLQLQRLPSSSPAHAAMSLEQKKKAWSIIFE
jgi:hypoxanthine-DNA glycosylase